MPNAEPHAAARCDARADFLQTYFALAAEYRLPTVVSSPLLSAASRTVGVEARLEPWQRAVLADHLDAAGGDVAPSGLMRVACGVWPDALGTWREGVVAADLFTCGPGDLGLVWLFCPQGWLVSTAVHCAHSLPA